MTSLQAVNGNLLRQDAIVQLMEDGELRQYAQAHSVLFHMQLTALRTMSMNFGSAGQSVLTDTSNTLAGEPQAEAQSLAADSSVHATQYACVLHLQNSPSSW